jgi:hypothetical protein
MRHYGRDDAQPHKCDVLASGPSLTRLATAIDAGADAREVGALCDAVHGARAEDFVTAARIARAPDGDE